MSAFAQKLNEIMLSTYVDKLIFGCFRTQVLYIKTIATHIFRAGESIYELELENEEIKGSEGSPAEVYIKADCSNTTFSKQQPGIQPWETKISGLLGDKKEDSIAKKKDPIYNFLGLISLVYLREKDAY